MLRLIVTLVAIGYATAILHSICHSNDMQLTEDQVVKELTDTCDVDNNGIIKEAEVVVAFARILDVSLPLSDQAIMDMNYQGLLGLADLFGFNIDRLDFVQSWHARFHDSFEFVGAIFDAFDNNQNGSWDIREVDGILNHIKETSDDGDGEITHSEFSSYFTAVYNNC